jgi:putative DNA primase/helicase
MTLYGYESSPVIQQFEAALTGRGLALHRRLVADGRIHRCDAKGKHGRGDGSYLLHLDGIIPAGGFQNWQDGAGWENWRFDPGRDLTSGEQTELKQKIAAARRSRDEDVARNRAIAREKAAWLWNNARPVARHPYLVRKQNAAYGVRVFCKYLLLVPMFDASGMLHGVQCIWPDGRKRYLRGGRVKGCFYRIAGDPEKICIAEGFATAASIHEATGYTVIVAFDAGNLRSVTEAVAKTSSGAELIICADDDWKLKAGNVGVGKATEAALAVGAKLAIPLFGRNRRDKNKDFNDLATFIGPDAVRRCLDDAKAPEVAEQAAETDTKQEFARLAKLSPVEYDQTREQTAQRIGIRLSTLDAEVANLRPRSADAAIDPLPHWEVDPWPDPVDGATLLDELATTFERYVVLPRYAAQALALWVLHTWTMNASDVSPFMVLKSPEMRCGKTTVLIILQFLTPKSELASNISPAAIFRYIEQHRPTLLIDEADTFVKGNDEIRGILNSGHTRASAHVIRTVEIGGEHRAKRFSTWAAKAIATIGSLAHTLADRSITILIQRKTQDQKVERLRRRDNSHFAELRRKAARWAQDASEALTAADDRTDVPADLHDRATDNWRPLLAIADHAGGLWPSRGRDAARALSGADGATDTASTRVQVLEDLKAAFREGEDALPTRVLIDRLADDPERPWAEYRNGKQLTPKQLGGLLRPFGIVSETIHVAGQPDAKGYKRAAFRDAWERYLPLPDQVGALETSKRPNACGTGTSGDFRSVQKGVPGRIEDVELSYGGSDLDGWTERTPPGSGKGKPEASDRGGACAYCGSGELTGDPLLVVAADGNPFHAHRHCIDRSSSDVTGRRAKGVRAPSCEAPSADLLKSDGGTIADRRDANARAKSEPDKLGASSWRMRL